MNAQMLRSRLIASNCIGLRWFSKKPVVRCARCGRPSCGLGGRSHLARLATVRGGRRLGLRVGMNPLGFNFRWSSIKESARSSADHVPKERGLFGAGVANPLLGDLRGVSEEVLGLMGHGADPCTRCR